MRTTYIPLENIACRIRPDRGAPTPGLNVSTQYWRRGRFILFVSPGNQSASLMIVSYRQLKKNTLGILLFYSM